jgi:hypothetical protein
VSKLAWFLALFSAGLALLFTPPQGAAAPDCARERKVQESELPCPFELGLDGAREAGRQAEEDNG